MNVPLPSPRPLGTGESRPRDPNSARGRSPRAELGPEGGIRTVERGWGDGTVIPIDFEFFPSESSVFAPPLLIVKFNFPVKKGPYFFFG